MNSSRRCIYSRLVGYQTQHQDCKTASLLKKAAYVQILDDFGFGSMLGVLNVI